MKVFWIVFFAWTMYAAARVGLPPANYVHPGKLPIVAFWNFTDRTRFTDEAVAYHKRTLKFAAQAGAIAMVGLILQAIFSG
jgi:hypothetical protein